MHQAPCLEFPATSKTVSYMQGLERLTRLRVLDVAANALAEVGSGLSTLAHLSDLWLNDNRITGLGALVTALAAPARSLTCVYLAGNPVADPPGAYRAALLRALPSLEQLDSDMVDPTEAARVRAAAAAAPAAEDR